MEAMTYDEKVRWLRRYQDSLRGLGQWRNNGKGRYVWEEIKDEAD